jgi:hypothetical protein
MLKDWGSGLILQGEPLPQHEADSVKLKLDTPKYGYSGFVNYKTIQPKEV